MAKKPDIKKELNRFITDRKKFFTNNCNYIKIYDKDAESYYFLSNKVLGRLNNANYAMYTFYLAQYLNKENKLVTINEKKKRPLQKQDIVDILAERFEVAKKTVENYLSVAKKANVLIKTQGNELVNNVYVMNPVAFNAGHSVFFAELMFYFPDDLIQLLSPYQYLACAKIVNVDYPKVNECKYLSMIDRTRYNIDKIMNGEMFEVAAANETKVLMSWTKAKAFIEKNGISDILGLPVRTRFNCIFHKDDKQLAVVIYKDGKERYYCMNDECVSTAERRGLDVFNLMYMLMGTEEDTENQFKMAMEYLAALYNIELDETTISIFNASQKEKD